MTTRAEYATVSDVRSNILNQSGTTDDSLILFFIRVASRDIGDISLRRFVPLIQTHYYDAPHWGGGNWAQLYTDRYTMDTKAIGGRFIQFDDDLLEVLTFTNGDGSSIASNQYALEPYNESVKLRLSLLSSATVSFVQNAAGDFQKALAISGVWGHHDDYPNAWVDTTTTLAVAITSTTATTFTSSAGSALKAGWLVKIDSEYLYVVSISTNTVTVIRGVNGSTAATHLISAPVSYWEVMFQIQGIAAQAATLYYNIRNNPGVQMVVDGHVISKPSDVRKFISDSLAFLGDKREAFA